MSKWMNDFVGKYKDTSTVKRLSQEIRDAFDKEKLQKEADKNLTDVIKGKYKRKFLK